MNYENFKTGFNKPSIFTAQQYGTKTTVEVDNSDLTLDEVMDAFQTLIIGMGYHESSFKNWVLDRADEYRQDDTTDATTPYTHEDFKKNEEFANLRHGYRATEEDEAEFDDYGMRIAEDRVGFEWGDVAEDDGGWIDVDDIKPNNELIDAAKKYKKALKTLSAKQKKKSK